MGNDFRRFHWVARDSQVARYEIPRAARNECDWRTRSNDGRDRLHQGAVTPVDSDDIHAGLDTLPGQDLRISFCPRFDKLDVPTRRREIPTDGTQKEVVMPRCRWIDQQENPSHQ